MPSKTVSAKNCSISSSVAFCSCFLFIYRAMIILVLLIESVVLPVGPGSAVVGDAVAAGEGGFVGDSLAGIELAGEGGYRSHGCISRMRFHVGRSTPTPINPLGAGEHDAAVAVVPRTSFSFCWSTGNYHFVHHDKFVRVNLRPSLPIRQFPPRPCGARSSYARGCRDSTSQSRYPMVPTTSLILHCSCL